MRVRLLRSLATAKGALTAGQELDVPRALALSWEAAGAAVIVEGVAPEEQPAAPGPTETPDKPKRRR